MTKNQKIWLAVFSSMFLIPEILWGGISWIIFKVFFPVKFFNNFDIGLFVSIGNNFAGFVVSLAQFIGLLGLILLFSKLKINLFIKILIIIILISASFFSGILTWMSFYYLFNTPQIG